MTIEMQTTQELAPEPAAPLDRADDRDLHGTAGIGYAAEVGLYGLVLLGALGILAGIVVACTAMLQDVGPMRAIWGSATACAALAIARWAAGRLEPLR